MGRHDILARKDEGISLVEFWGCHKFDHMNEAAALEWIEGRLPSCTNTNK